MQLFHKSSIFGSCTIHILYTGCAKIKKNNSGAKRFIRQGSSYPLRGPEPGPGIIAKHARGVIKGRMSRKHEEYWQSICGQRKAKAFLKILCYKSLGITQLEQEPAMNNDGTANGTLKSKRTSIYTWAGIRK